MRKKRSHGQADRRVWRAASIALRRCCRSVVQRLQSAACAPDPDGEDVHQLRVGARRALAALRVYREVFPKKRARRLRRWLRRIRRAAEAARDADVLRQRLDSCAASVGPEVLDLLRQRREEAQAPLVAEYGRLCGGQRLTRRVKRLIDRLRQDRGGRLGRQRLCRFAPPRLRDAADRFFGAAGFDRSDTAALHRLRIRAKKLRYQMELFTPVLPGKRGKRLRRQLADVQERLGRMNDLATALVRYREWAACPTADHAAGQIGGQAAVVDSKAPWSGLLEEDSRELERLQAEFYSWWTPQRVAALRQEFDTWLSG